MPLKRNIRTVPGNCNQSDEVRTFENNCLFVRTGRDNKGKREICLCLNDYSILYIYICFRKTYRDVGFKGRLMQV